MALVLILDIIDLLKVIFFWHGTADVLLCGSSWTALCSSVIGVLVLVPVLIASDLFLSILAVCIVVALFLLLVIVSRLLGSPGLLWRCSSSAQGPALRWRLLTWSL